MKKMMLIVLSAFVLTACDYNLTEAEMEAARNQDALTHDSEPFLPTVGSELKIKYVQHVQNEEYELGYIENKKLIWMNTNYFGFHINVEYDDSLPSSLLVRNQNSAAVKLDGLEVVAEYTLFVKGNVEGGTITRDCGDHCTEEIQTIILDSKN